MYGLPAKKILPFYWGGRRGEVAGMEVRLYKSRGECHTFSHGLILEQKRKVRFSWSKKDVFNFNHPVIRFSNFLFHF